MRRILAASLLLAASLAGCDVAPTAPGGPELSANAQLAKNKKKTGTSSTSTAAHTVQFGGDVLSAPILNVMLDPNKPFANVAIPTTPLTLPDVPDLLGCGAVGGNWTPYAGNWTGYFAMTGDGSTATINFTAYAADGTPFWLSVSGATRTESAGASTTVTFTDVTAMAKMDKSPLVVIFPCTTFSITATRQ